MMAGTLGDFLVLVGVADAPSLRRLDDERFWPPMPLADSRVQSNAPVPGIRVWWRGDVGIRAEARGGLGMAIAPLQGHTRAQATDPRAAVLGDWCRDARFEPQSARGRFAYVLWDAASSHAPTILACTDTFRTCSIFHVQTPSGLLLASDLRLIVRSGLVSARPSHHAMYQYLNFSYVPAPVTAIEGVSKLPAGHCLEARGASVSLRPYWDATYPADLKSEESQRAAQLRETIVNAVQDHRCGDAQGWGTFLSGGTDSSSISGILARAHNAKVNSFSIGFEEEGYDELTYSRIASDAFGLQAHEYRVNENDTVEAIPKLALAYDEPFGNSSAIPTFYCATLAARIGVRLMVAGDGGDEIFGGNERYRKDEIFEMFHRAPAPVRWLGHGLAAMLKPVETRFANRIKNFVHRGSLPNPDRFYSDDSFASDHFDELLSDDFRRMVGRDDALEVQRRVYAQAKADCTLNRLMYLDLKMTIADNDLVKVVRAARMAGVDVIFPYLDKGLIDFTGRLPGTDKVRGSSKRHLFKLATDNILPEAIRKKKKQGFGLPVSVWLRRGGRYHDLVHEVVLSQRALDRGYFRPAFVRQLIERHERGLWDHSAELHMLLMLELWHREYIDTHG
jgi:asparagine synthase (glutamine-hydrolysing)